jgi:hypothetical protein
VVGPCEQGLKRKGILAEPEAPQELAKRNARGGAGNLDKGVEQVGVTRWYEHLQDFEQQRRTGCDKQSQPGVTRVGEGKREPDHYKRAEPLDRNGKPAFRSEPDRRQAYDCDETKAAPGEEPQQFLVYHDASCTPEEIIIVQPDRRDRVRLIPRRLSSIHRHSAH